jgi:hypothetical protein
MTAVKGLLRVVRGVLPPLLVVAFPAAFLAAQTTVANRAHQAGTPPANLLQVVVRDTVTVVPGRRYGAGWMKRWLFGAHYRALWTTPLRVPVLDLEHTAGGLTAERRGGGQQTHSLRFRAADGRRFAFRSLDKDPAAILAPDLRGTVVQDLVQDQISAAHPAGPLISAAVMSIVGVPTSTPTLVQLPTSERLGPFNGEFVGMLGYIQVRAEKGTSLGPGQPLFVDVVNSEKLIARLRSQPTESVNAPAYLTARLVDFFLGDWDRHRGQWRWGRRTEEAAWEPIPSDRDQALVRYDGLLLHVARERAAPQLVKFGGNIPVTGLTWNGRDLDRMILPRLDRSTWDSVTAFVVSRLDDAALDSVVRAVPPEFGEHHRRWLRATLASRRASLNRASRQFRAQIERTPELLLTDAPERIDLTREADASLRVVVHAAGNDSATLDHTFRPDETKEVRIYALGGDDSLAMEGRNSRIGVRFIGGAGRDTLESRSAPRLTYVPGGARWREAPEEDSPPPPRDYGSRTQRIPRLGFASDQGLVAGFWLRRTSYGFRRFPHATSWTLQGVVGSATGRPGVYLDADVQSRDSVWFFGLSAHATGAERMRWYGLGNQTVELDDRDLHLVDNWRLQLEPTLNLRLGSRLVVGAGPSLRYTRTTAQPGRLLAVDAPYGSGDFGQVGAVGYLRWEQSAGTDRRRSSISAEIGGRVMPAVWDNDSTYGSVHAGVLGRLAAGGSLQPVLTLGVRGEKVWGTAPFFDLATIGGASTLRGYSSQRFRGDAALVGSSELRIRLARATIILPGDVGVLGIGDVGRVFLDGQTSDKWHAAAGGGLWLSWLGGVGSLAISVVHSSERTTVYAGSGFSY